jgi:hypothetical protein
MLARATKNANDVGKTNNAVRSALLIGHCIPEALEDHSIHEVGAQDVLPEALLLQ